MAASDRPLLGIVNTSEEICNLLADVFTEAGYQVLSTLTVDVKRGRPDFQQFVRARTPVAVIYDIAIPYEENWRYFQELQASDAGRNIRFVLTCINKRALESLVGPTPTLEIIGKPYDLEQLLAAVRQAVDQEPPDQPVDTGTEGSR